jgi:tryptophanase
VDLPCPQALSLDSLDPFKGNIDLTALEAQLTGPHGGDVGLVIMTITNNGGGGQPVSMANLTAAGRICRTHDVPFFLDAARFAENAWLVIQREPGFADWTPRDVARAAFELVDGAMASLKKDGISPIGGFLGLRDDELAQRCELLLIATEGFPTYGGLAGHDLEALAQGLREVVDPRYLQARTCAALHLAKLVETAGVSIVRPAGLHAIYLNAGSLLPHIPPHRFPGHALACQLYLEGGIRSVELGSLYLGQNDEHGNLATPAPHELVRLALPRRVYTQSHLEYVANVLADIAKHPEQVPGYRIVEASPFLRHFTSRLEPVP